MKESMMSADAAYSQEAYSRDLIIASIVSSYVSKNPVQAADLPKLIQSVREALTGDGANSSVQAEPAIEKPTPAQIKKSVTPDAIISFIDGKPYKSMRRHLTTHGLTPETYRQRYGLDPSYPIVSANYSAERSRLAKSLGLGQQRRNWPEKAEEAAPAPEPTKAAQKRKKADPKVSEQAAA